MYAIVDIETTGGYAAANGITEIAIRHFDGENVTGRFETLINPQQPIPRYIQGMTGITDAMVATAPLFEDVASEVFAYLKDRIFIAHNVNFDYSFLKAHLASRGFQLNTRKLCTVRLSRKIIPGYPSYSLGRLCDSLGIQVDNRHRAGGDLDATVELFRLLLQKDQQQFIRSSLRKDSKEQMLPPNLPREEFDKLPYTPGVYYFHNSKDRIVYIGKAKNLKYRVNSHFSNNSESRQKQNFINHVHRIRYTECGTELMAHILESAEIRHWWPAFNHSQKRREDVYGIFAFEDQCGFLRLAIEKNKKHLRPLHTFHYMVTGHALLRKLIKDYNLCARFCYLQQDSGPCEGVDHGHCFGVCCGKEDVANYNTRVRNAIASLKNEPSFAIVESGRNPDEKSCILMLKGQFWGMGYLPANEPVTSTEQLQKLLTPYRESMFVRNLVMGYAASNPASVIHLHAEEQLDKII
ncbi:MAG: exonuclease domain-containing protein [Chitinophagaceae bacterium]|nr:exonuclease domain-containing protein [Chitinophagaceae bacterium]